MTEKVKNYTDEQTAELVSNYVAAETQEGRDRVVTVFADTFGKKKASIVAKLVSEGVYVSAAKAAVAKPKKAELVTMIAAQLGVEEDEVGSLEKATREALVTVAEVLLARELAD